MDSSPSKIKRVTIFFLITCAVLLFARYGLRNSVPASDGPLSDMLLQMVPQRYFTDQVLNAGHRPLWNPFSGLGNDESTTLWYHPLYPTTHLTRIFGLAFGMNLEIFLHLLLAFFSMRFYLKKLGLSFYPSVFGAVSFAGSGMLTAYCFAPPLLMSAAYLPAIMWAIEGLLEKKSLLFAGLLGVIAGLHVLEGMVQYTLYFLMVFIFYIPFRIYSNRKTGGMKKVFGLLLLAGIIAVLISAGRIIPWWVNLDRMRGGYGEYKFFAERLFDLSTLFTILAPKLFETVRGIQQVDLKSFVGIAPVVAAIFAAIKLRKNPMVRFHIIVLIFSVALTADWLPVRLLWGGSEIFASLTPTRLWILGVFSISTLGAFGVQFAIDNKNILSLSKKWSRIGSIGGAFLAISMMTAVAIKGGHDAAIGLPTIKSAALTLFVFSIVYSSAFVKGAKIKGALLVFAVTINCFFVFWAVNPAKHLDRVYAKTPITKALEGKPGRLMRIGRAYSFLQNDRVYEAKALVFGGVFDLHTLALMPDMKLTQAYEELFGPPKEGTLMFYRRTRLLPPEKIGEKEKEFLDKLQIRFLLVNGELSDMTPIAFDGPLNLYDRGGKGFPLRISHIGSGKNGETKWGDGFNSIFTTLSTGLGATVEFSQSFRKGWKAFIDGDPVETYTKDGLSIFVEVLPGNHEVVFKFTAPYVKQSDMVTIIGYLLGSLIIAFGIFLGQRRNRNE